MLQVKAALSSQFPCAACAIVLLVLLCYWNSLDGDLVHDDIFAIRDNLDLRSDTPLAQVLKNDFWGKPMSSPLSHKSYRPLTVLTFRLNYALHALRPRGYHAVNMAMHAAATLLFGWVCRRVVFAGSGAERGALLCMLMFASHPVHTEAVSVQAKGWGLYAGVAPPISIGVTGCARAAGPPPAQVVMSGLGREGLPSTDRLQWLL